jgi:hypothetical protein
MQQEKVRVVWKALLWLFWGLILVVAFLGLIAQLGEVLTRVAKAWGPILF